MYAIHNIYVSTQCPQQNGDVIYILTLTCYMRSFMIDPRDWSLSCRQHKLWPSANPLPSLGLGVLLCKMGEMELTHQRERESRVPECPNWPAFTSQLYYQHWCALGDYYYFFTFYFENNFKITEYLQERVKELLYTLNPDSAISNMLAHIFSHSLSCFFLNHLRTPCIQHTPLPFTVQCFLRTRIFSYTTMIQLPNSVN